MANPIKQRKAVTLFADIEGYTAMMEKNESETATLLNYFQTQVKEKIKTHNGQIIHFYGDGVLCVFENSKDAVYCAMELQTNFNQSIFIPVRIGIHKGKITFEKNTVYGHTINVTSRIESLGLPKAILLSKIVAEEIAKEDQLFLKYLGKFTFKNVIEPIGVFAIANEGFIVPKRSELKGKLKSRTQPIWLLPVLFMTVFLLLGVWFTDKPTPANSISEKSVAILPFENLSKDSTPNYLSDGIAQDILTNLSGIQDLLVISFNSSKHFRESEKTTNEIGDALGAHHLLMGSVQHVGEQLRIRTMLVNAKTDQQIWAKRYDLELKDLFSLQSEISNEIAEALKAEILPVETARINEKPTENLAAWQEYSQGRYQWELRTKEGFIAAEKHFLKAIALDSNFALAYTGLAQTYTLQGTDFYSRRDLLFTKSKELAEKALSLNPRIGDAYATLGYYYFSYEIDIPKSINFYEKGVKYDPGNPTTHQWYAEALISQGNIEKARVEIDIACRLDPRSRIMKVIDALVLLCEDKYAEARIYLETLCLEYPDLIVANRFLVKTYLMTGQIDKAVNLWKETEPNQALPKDFLLETRRIKEIKARLNQPDLPEGLRYLMETDLILLTGSLSDYIARVDSAIFYYNYNTTDMLQYFPPPDSVRLHPEFQKMIKKGKFHVRPRSEKLKQVIPLSERTDY